MDALRTYRILAAFDTSSRSDFARPPPCMQFDVVVVLLHRNRHVRGIETRPVKLTDHLLVLLEDAEPIHRYDG